MEFEERLNKIIIESGDEKKVFAEKCGKSESQLYNYLNGSQAPGFYFFKKIKSNYPKVNLEWLIVGDEPSDDIAMFLPDDSLEHKLKGGEIEERTKLIGAYSSANKKGDRGIRVHQTAEKDTGNLMTDDERKFYHERIRFLEERILRLERKLDRIEERDDPMEDHDDVLVTG